MTTELFCVILLLLLLGTTTITTVAGATTSDTRTSEGFNCKELWPRPSGDNSISECVRKHAFGYTSQPQYYVLIVLGLVLASFAALCGPVVMVRYCCGCNRRRPDGCIGSPTWDNEPTSKKNAEYIAHHHCKYCACRWMPVVLFFSTIIVIALVVHGQKLIAERYDWLISNLESEVFPYFEHTAKDIKRLASDSDGKLQPPVQEYHFAQFDNMSAHFRDEVLHPFHDHSESAKIILYYCLNALSIVPSLIALLLLGMVVFDKRRCVILVVFISIPFAILLGLSGGAVFSLYLPARNFCHESENSSLTEAGNIYSWKIVPDCEERINSTKTSLMQELETAKKIMFKETCKEVTNICDQNPVPISPALFLCENITPAVPPLCESEADVNSLIQNASIKNEAVAPPCEADVTRPDKRLIRDPVQEACTLRTCFLNCRPEIKSYAVRFEDNFTSSINLQAALVVLEKATCLDFISKIRHSVLPCGKALTGIILMGTGLIIGALLLLIMICVSFAGQKVFFKKTHRKKYRKKNKKESAEPYECEEGDHNEAVSGSPAVAHPPSSKTVVPPSSSASASKTAPLPATKPPLAPSPDRQQASPNRNHRPY